MIEQSTWPEVNRMQPELDALEEENNRLRELLRRCKKFLEHAPEFPYRLVMEYDIEDLQDELAKELKDE